MRPRKAGPVSGWGRGEGMCRMTRLWLLGTVATLCSAHASQAQTPESKGSKPAVDKPKAEEPNAEKPKAEKAATLPRIDPREAARRIKKVMAKGSDAQILAVLHAYGLYDHSKVVSAVATGLKHKRVVVRWAALIVLRYHPNKLATGALLKHKSNKLISGMEETAVEYWLALGQRADRRALRPLSAGFGRPKGEAVPVTAARCKAMGRIRDRDAIDALVRFGRSGFAYSPALSEPIMMSLSALTGHSTGSTRMWAMWWSSSRRKSYEVEAEVRLPLSVRAEWKQLWKTPKPRLMFARIPGVEWKPLTPEPAAKPKAKPKRGR